MMKTPLPLSPYQGEMSAGQRGQEAKGEAERASPQLGESLPAAGRVKALKQSFVRTVMFEKAPMQIAGR
tara:strand:- start:2192 stop:2398 length:207 start_codon:yes stop_codon:yes gene_type:complete